MKLYWRYKKAGKWTWKSAERHRPGDYTGKWDEELGKFRRYVTVRKEEEEE